MILGSVFGEYRDAYRLGRVAYELAQRGALTWKSRIFVIVGNVVNSWTQPMRSNIPYLLAAFPAAQEAGDLAGACYCHNHLVSTLLAVGEPLAEVYAKIERGLKFVRAVNYPAIADILIGQQRLVLAMQGKTRRFSGCGDDGFDEPAYEARIAASQMALLKFWFFTWKLQACYLYGQVDEALAAGEAGCRLLWSSPGHVEEAEHHFYHALALAAACGAAQGAQRDAYLDEIVAYRDRFRLWSDNCPENFAHKYHLLEAELARLTQQDLLALRSYDQAIRLAKESRFIQNAAVSCELAASFYEKAGMRAFAQQSLLGAVAAYQAWGAYGKVRELMRRFSYLSVEVQAAPAAQSIDIDLVSVLRASQSISSEILPAQLSKKLMRILVEVSGAERGFLILRQDQELNVEAVARTSPSGLEVELVPSKPIREFALLPKSILSYTLRSQEKVLIVDARVSHRFSRDKALVASQRRSILCLPIVRNRALVGMVYLENDLVTEAFTSDKLAVLEILAAQAAISIDNARLYAELSAEEEKWRATLESMADGLMVCDVTGQISLINDAAMRTYGLEGREALETNAPALAELLDFRDAKGVLVRREDLPLWRALRGETLTQQEYLIRQVKSGRSRVLRLSAAPMRQSAGEIVGAVFVVQDVTELTALDRLKDEFLRAVAHELKTPLMVVTAYFELFSELAKSGGGGSDAQLQDCAERMGGGLKRLGSLIETLVDVSHIHLGKLKLRPETFDLRAMCQELVEAMAIMSSKHRLRLEGGAGGPLLIRGDRVRLGQVLTNLLGNAIKYSPEGGDVELAIREEVGSVVVSVKDQGIGIPVERQDRLFQRFYRAHAETEHDYGGMGVGLFLAQEIVLAHHGTMWFSSEAGKGSTFYLSLPHLQLKTC
jgi:PAS domain S-box-containing protein